MKQLDQAEKSLSGVFKDLPPLPPSAKESIVRVMPWIALVFGVIQVVAAWAVYGLARVVDRAADLVNTYSAFYAAVAPVHLSAFDRTIIYLGAVVLLVDGVIGILAFNELKKRSAHGWDLLFLAALVNVAYAVIAIFINNRGFGSFLSNLLGSAIGFYFLFQIRSAYKGKVTPVTPVPPVKS